MHSKDIIDGFRTTSLTTSVAGARDQILGKTMFPPLETENRISDKKIIGPAIIIYGDITDEKLPPQHVLDAIDEPASGLITVITENPSLEAVAVWGGPMTAGAVANKHEAVVSSGDVRDLMEVRRDYDFPVYAKMIAPGTIFGRLKTISVSQSVTIGDAMMNSGDLVVGDIDDVVCVPQAVVVEVLALAQSIDSRELEQAKLIIQSGSPREGLMKHGRI